MTAARRDLRPVEMEVIAELATSCPDLVAAKDRLLAALSEPTAAPAGKVGLQPGKWRELIEGVKLGVLNPGQARRFLNIPQAEPGALAQLARSRWQRGGIF